MIITNLMRTLLVERDNRQPSYFWRNPNCPQKNPQVTKRTTRNVDIAIEFLTERGWRYIERLNLWEDWLTKDMLCLQKAYYTELRRSV